MRHTSTILRQSTLMMRRAVLALSYVPACVTNSVETPAVVMMTSSMRLQSSSSTTTATNAAPTTRQSSTATAAAAAATPLLPSVVKPFTGTPEAFIRLVQDTPIVVVNFTAQWCKPCVEIKSCWEELARKYALSDDSSSSGGGGANALRSANDSSSKYRIAFVDVDISQNDSLAAVHDVRCVPTFCCYLGGNSDVICGEGLGVPVTPGHSADVEENRKLMKEAMNDDREAASTTSYSPTCAHHARGLFGTVEGAHLSHVERMVDAALRELKKEE